MEKRQFFYCWYCNTLIFPLAPVLSLPPLTFTLFNLAPYLLCPYLPLHSPCFLSTLPRPCFVLTSPYLHLVLINLAPSLLCPYFLLPSPSTFFSLEPCPVPTLSLLPLAFTLLSRDPCPVPTLSLLPLAFTSLLDLAPPLCVDLAQSYFALILSVIWHFLPCSYSQH